MIEHFLVTGDIHGKIEERVSQIDTTLYPPDNTTALICLGDVGFNFYLNPTDRKRKEFAQNSGYIFYCIRGNHELRPENLPNIVDIYDEDVDNFILIEKAYPNVRYLIDGEEYKFGEYSTLVIGGAYSIDKWYRLDGRPEDTEQWTGWFKNEMLSTKEMALITRHCCNNLYDFVLTHTCPKSWEPTDLFIGGIDQNTIDKSMENWLDIFKDCIYWNVWLFGHYHDDRYVQPGVEMFYHAIVDLDDIWEHEQALKRNV